jgi:hypothetical protein
MGKTAELHPCPISRHASRSDAARRQDNGALEIRAGPDCTQALKSVCHSVDPMWDCGAFKR